MCFFYLLQYLIAAIKPIQKKNVTRIIQSWTQHTHLCSSYFNHCYKSIKSVNPSSSACSTRHPTAKHPQNLPIPTPGRLKSQLETSKILSHPLCKEHISKCWNQTMHPTTGEMYRFNNKAPLSITRYQLKAKTAGKSSWYRSAVSPRKKALTWIPSPANHRDVNPKWL